MSADGRTNPPERKVQRHSPHRLLRHKLVLPGDVTVSAEKHKGRLVVRVETPVEAVGSQPPQLAPIHGIGDDLRAVNSTLLRG